jgi:hypothetical protein
MRDDPAFDWTQAEKDMADGIDTTDPHSARVWDYWLGGKDPCRADQEAVTRSRRLCRASPTPSAS